MSDRRPPSAKLSWDDLDSFERLNETIGTPFINVSAGMLKRLGDTIRELCVERERECDSLRAEVERCASTAVACAEDVAEAIHHLESLGIVSADDTGGKGLPEMIDEAIAKAIQAAEQHTRAICREHEKREIAAERERVLRLIGAAHQSLWVNEHAMNVELSHALLNLLGAAIAEGKDMLRDPTK